jgi:signal transduction histidine kinase
VRDDGRGFDPGISRKGVGRDSMCQRALDLGGGVEVQSKPGRGTRVLCRVPMGKNALKYGFSSTKGRSKD